MKSYGPNTWYTNICAVCGKEFRTRHRDQKCCSPGCGVKSRTYDLDADVLLELRAKGLSFKRIGELLCCSDTTAIKYWRKAMEKRGKQ